MLYGVLDAVDVRTGLAFSVVDAIADEELGGAEVESDTSVDSVDGIVYVWDPITTVVGHVNEPTSVTVVEG